MSNNRPDPNAPPGTPRWVKIFVIVFIALVLLVIILHLMGFGMAGHGMSVQTSLIEHGLKRL